MYLGDIARDLLDLKESKGKFGNVNKYFLITLHQNKLP